MTEEGTNVERGTGGVAGLHRKSALRKTMERDWVLYLMALPAVALVFIFCYVPMYGVLMAFENYIPAKGILGSKWVGLAHFRSFLRDPFCGRIVKNTVILGVMTTIFSFPAPVILALLFNELREGWFKRVAQTISYMPFFISTVIVVGMMFELFSLSGIVNEVIGKFGAGPISYMERPEWFRTLYIGSGIWQGVGYSSIIYLAAITGVNPELYESAVLDGAGRLRQILSITLPSIMPTVSIMFILQIGGILGTDLQKILLMYSPGIYETADVISTYVYRKGLLGGQFSYSSAVGLLMSVISFVLLWISNQAAKKIGSESLM